MTARTLAARHERWPLKTPFAISRGVKTAADVVVVEIASAGAVGRGECVPYARYGETIESVLGQIETVRAAVEAGADNDEIARLMRPGAARNAVDCALLDLRSRLERRPVWDLLGLEQPRPAVTATTISLDTPERMAEAARRLADMPLLKVKVGREDVIARVAAVRRNAPAATLIVDPNESWTPDLLADLMDPMASLGVRVIEQPCPAGADVPVAHPPSLKLCADESCHTEDDLPRLAGTYDMINIKLDKAGGLTAACRLADAARTQGFEIMVGCMVATSLSMAPATMLAGRAVFIDLDGPLWLARDRDAALVCEHGRIFPPTPQLWGWSD